MVSPPVDASTTAPAPPVDASTTASTPSPNAIPLGRPSVSPSPSTRDAFDRRAAKLELRPRFGGGYTYLGLPGERFDAWVRDDGTVVFEVDDGFDIETTQLCLVAVCLLRSPSRPGRNRTPPRARAAKAGRVATEVATLLLAGYAASRSNGGGRVSYSPGFTGMHPRNQPMPGSLGGMASGRYGYLPAPHRQMTDFLERTFSFRLDLAEHALRQRLERELSELPAVLAAIWSDETLDSAQRRQRILAYWADLETPVAQHEDDVLDVEARPVLDLARREMAQRARAVIVDFVVTVLPVGSASAFTRSELDAFNRTLSGTHRFEPYRVYGPQPQQ